MSSFYQTVIGIISKPSEYRQDEEVQLILGWFIDLFRKMRLLFELLAIFYNKLIIFSGKNKNEDFLFKSDFPTKKYQ